VNYTAASTFPLIIDL